MKIILLNGHEALVVDDKKPVVHVVNGGGGTLVVNGNRIAIVDGVTQSPVVENNGCRVRAHYENDKGIRWKVIRPSLTSNGSLYSSVDYMSEYIKMRVHLDRLDRRYEELCSEVLDLRAKIEHDSLGFMNIGGNENENE